MVFFPATMFIAMFPGLSPQPLLIEEETMSLSLVKIHENPWMVFLLAIILPQMFRFRKKRGDTISRCHKDSSWPLCQWRVRPKKKKGLIWEQFSEQRTARHARRRFGSLGKFLWCFFDDLLLDYSHGLIQYAVSPTYGNIRLFLFQNRVVPGQLFITFCYKL